ncbi:hypothetical protein EMCRGX_G000345 [Ephydatia muelleri]
MTVIGLMAAPKIHLKSVRSMQRNTPGLLDRRIGPKDMFIVLLYMYCKGEPDWKSVLSRIEDPVGYLFLIPEHNSFVNVVIV